MKQKQKQKQEAIKNISLMGFSVHFPKYQQGRQTIVFATPAMDELTTLILSYDSN